MSLLVLLAQRGPNLDWVVQAVIVLIFLILPVVRTLAEQRKRGAGRGKQPTAKTPRSPAKKEQLSGRDLWRRRLEPGPALERSMEVEPRTLERTPLERPVGERIPLERPIGERPRLERPVGPRPSLERAPAIPVPPSSERMEERHLSPYATEIAPEPGPAAVATVGDVDPATLDDEVARRWGALGAAEDARPAIARLSSATDWRAAVLVSELLSPPLALRGRSSAWPGPPASLAG